MKKNKITVKTIVSTTITKAWECWTNPKHIINWNFASNDWHCPKAENDLKIGGKFTFTMSSKDGQMSFDFIGIYTQVTINQKIAYTMEDDREAEILFELTPNGVEIIESFEPENENPLELQQAGWLAILNNFKIYVESL
jgi:uncharacterized protein YndB with AHSA1/START domain